MPTAITRIGLFFDGNYFSSASTYYLTQHARRSRIGLSGIRKFATQYVAREEGLDVRHCRIVEAHLFAGRMRAQEAREREEGLFKDRLWEEILQREAVTAHFLPNGPRGEKGIDVALALECYDAVVQKGLDVVVLVTGDGDFVPLVRKLNARGVRVVILGFSYAYDSMRKSFTSRLLLAEATYPVELSDLIDRYDELDEQQKELVDGLFVMRRAETEDEMPGAESLIGEFTPGSSPADEASDAESGSDPAGPVSSAVSSIEPSAAPVAEPDLSVEKESDMGSATDDSRSASLLGRRASRYPAFRNGSPATRQKLERFAQEGFSSGGQAEREDLHPAVQNREAEVISGRITGRVTRILENYGFIKGDWGDSNPFFHKSEVVGDGFDHMQPGTPVSYLEATGDRGTVAKSVQVLNDPE